MADARTYVVEGHLCKILHRDYGIYLQHCNKTLSTTYVLFYHVLNFVIYSIQHSIIAGIKHETSKHVPMPKSLDYIPPVGIFSCLAASCILGIIFLPIVKILCSRIVELVVSATFSLIFDQASGVNFRFTAWCPDEGCVVLTASSSVAPALIISSSSVMLRWPCHISHI